MSVLAPREPHFASRARRMRSDARAGPDVSEYQATLDRLRDLGFDGDAELLERSLPVPHAERPPGSSWAAATPEPQMSPAELLAFDKFVEVLASRHDDAMLGLTKLALNRAHALVKAGGRAAPRDGEPLANLVRSSEAVTFEGERVAAERMRMLGERLAVEQAHAGLQAERAAVAAERRELEWVRSKLAATMPDGAAARLQAQHRAMQASRPSPLSAPSTDLPARHRQQHPSPAATLTLAPALAVAARAGAAAVHVSQGRGQRQGGRAQGTARRGGARARGARPRAARAARGAGAAGRAARARRAAARQ